MVKNNLTWVRQNMPLSNGILMCFVEPRYLQNKQNNVKKTEAKTWTDNVSLAGVSLDT